jgi:hypothetical protein
LDSVEKCSEVVFSLLDVLLGLCHVGRKNCGEMEVMLQALQLHCQTLDLLQPLLNFLTTV